MMIMNSCKSLVWALVMLAIILYVFGICFTSFASTFSRDQPDHPYTPAVATHFGDLYATITTLLESMLNGMGWSVVADTALEMGYVEFVLFYFFIFFSMLAVMNVITGVFVENAIQSAKSQRDYLIN